MRHGTHLALGVATAVILAAAPTRAADKTDAPAKKEDVAATPEAAPAAPAAAMPPSAPEAAPLAPALPPPAPVVTAEGSTLPPSGVNWKTTIYGFAEFDVFRDSTQSYVDGSSSTPIARPGTVAGDNSRTQFTPRNSRLGLKLEASPFGDFHATAQAEMDFYGNQAPGASESATYTNAPIRMRHYFLKLQSPYVDVLAGQYHDLFAWGGSGFFPNSVAFLSLFGEIYHRNPQLRISKTIRTAPVDVEVAIAAVRPVGRDDELPDGQAGVRFAFNGWKGVRAQGSGPPDAGPLAVGLSAVGRRLRVNPFQAMIGDYKTANGYGVAVNVVIPVVPCTPTDLSNGVTITGEATMGTGIGDLYSSLTGGAHYSVLPNPMLLLVPPPYVSNIDPGIVVFDANGNVRTVNWRALVAGLQYHLPIAAGKKVWVTGNFSAVSSTNLASITPEAQKATIWTKGYYWDANAFLAITPAVQFDVSFQTTTQVYGDNLTATNHRAELALHYFF
jgi:hypothetical protein